MKKTLIFLIISLFSIASIAQKKPLTHDVYDSWKSIADYQISSDGKWLVYSLNLQEGDGNLIFKNLKSSKIDSIRRGAELKLSYNSENAIFKIKPPITVTKDAKRAKKKKEEMPKDSLGIYNLTNATLSKIPNIISFKIPEKADGWLAYLQESPIRPVKKDSTQKNIKIKPPKKENEENGYSLVIQNLRTNAKSTYNYVTDYEFSKNGKSLVFASTGNDSTFKSGVYIWDFVKSAPQSIFENKGKFKKFSFTEDGNQLAFVADLDTNAKTLMRNPKLYYWKTIDKIATMLADSSKNPAPKNWLVNAEFTPNFSKDGSKLFFGTNPKPLVKDTTLLPEEIVSLDVWNWQDKRLITQQNATVERDKKKSYLAVLHLNNGQMIQLSNPQTTAYQLVNEGDSDYVLAASDIKYSSKHWDWHNTIDIFTISAKTGETAKIAENIKVGNSLKASPKGQYLYWYSLADTAWFAHSIQLAKTIKLTTDIKFAEEDDDHPDFPNEYGVLGWTKNDARFLVYDKYDIWSIDPNKPSEAENLTHGREKNITYRYIKLDPEERAIDVSKTLILRVFDNISKESGYAQLLVGNKSVSEKLKGAYVFSPQIIKAKNTDDIIFARSNFKESPDLFASDLNFKTINKVSESNLQQKNYLWGSVEIVKWQSLDGIPLEGLLYKPENFDASKKYPMITYYYEKNADNLNQYYAPAPGRSIINFTYYVSNGYLVFVPDIVYKIGYPGVSAYNCVMPGVLNLLDKGYVDKDRMGLQGHSWGGYQTAYIITQTNLFRAAEAGAPVSNMTSAYGGIRWETGLSRQAQYENTQTRIGGTLWEKPMQYLENSPLFQLPKVQTPLLILHNDADDAVPWYQGIELFMGLKRLEKPTWMLTYNGEKHGLVERKNRKDFTIRMSQFFDYYLKNAPIPVWMRDGIPATEKTLNYGLELK